MNPVILRNFLNHLKYGLILFLLIAPSTADAKTQVPGKPKITAAQEAVSQSPQDVQINIKDESSKACNQFTFDATQSYDPDKQDLTYFWEFGDGATSTEAIATHTYDKSGKYTVKLAVTDNSNSHCNAAATAQVITADFSPKAAFSIPPKACANQVIAIEAEETHTDRPGPMSYWWDFGDGTRQEGRSGTKSYKAPGDYQVTLMVDDNGHGACGTNRVQHRIHINEPPQAVAGPDIEISCQNSKHNHPIQFNASNSKSSSGGKLTYYWDFGDDHFAQGKIVSHEYEHSGDYNVQLTVADDSGLTCNKSTDTLTVSLRNGPVAQAGGDRTACLSEELKFDASASQGSDADIFFTKWDFGDGSSERGMEVFHTYSRPGKYIARLNIEPTDREQGCPPSEDQAVIQIIAPPDVSLRAPEAVCLGEKVAFEAVANDPNGRPLTYFWSFGDGSVVSGGPRITHVFSKSGTFPVQVIVDNGTNSDCSSVSASHSVKVNAPPKANAGENTACCLGEPTVFNALNSSDPDGDALSFHWDFGDGNTSEEAVTRHVYQQSGTYQVKLQVNDNAGTSCSVDTKEFTAQINETPIPIMKVK